MQPVLISAKVVASCTCRPRAMCTR